MESNSNYQATIVLTIPSVELYHNIRDQMTLIHTGSLHVLYMTNFNSFIMQINDFNYALSSDIPVLAAPAKDAESFPSYVFPYLDGYYIVKVIWVKNVEALSNLETIFSNHCDLAYQENREVKRDFEEREAFSERENIMIQLDNPEKKEPAKLSRAIPEEAKESKESPTKVASGVIVKGGDLAKAGFIKSAEVISKGIGMFGSYIIKKYGTRTNANVSNSTITKLQVANTATKAAFTFTRLQVQAIFAVGTEITKQVAKSLAKTDTGEKVKNMKHTDKVVEIGKSTLNAAASIYDGMSQALTILAKGVGDTTTKVVNHKYGEKAAEATKLGLDAIGNIGKTTTAYSDQVVRTIGENTATRKAQ